MLNDFIKSNNISNNGNNAGIMSSENNGTINNETNIYNFFSQKEKQKRKVPALIPKIIKILANKSANKEFAENNDFQVFKVSDKLIYNNIRASKYMIKEYSKYYSSIDKFMNQYDDIFTGDKNKILNCIHGIYLKEKGKILAKYNDNDKTDIEQLQLIADELIAVVKNHLIDIVNNSDENIFYEDLSVGLDYFICYSFIRCNIFEKPNNLEENIYDYK